MNNNYFTNVGSYMQPVDPNELARLNPTFQNIGMQQANQNAAMQQGMNLTNQAGQTGQSGSNPLMMAAMLRKKDPNKPAPITDNSQMMPNTDLGYNNLV